MTSPAVWRVDQAHPNGHLVTMTDQEAAIHAADQQAAATAAIGTFNKNVAAAVLMDRLRNNLDDVKTARGAIQGGSMFASLSVAEKAFLALICDELDALARLKVNIYEIVD